MALSVDGFIAGKNGDMDWLNNQPTIEGEDMGFSEFLTKMDLMIMGRKTFDTVVGFGIDSWPYGSLPIIVLTRNVETVLVPDWIQQKGTVAVRSATSPQALWKELEVETNYHRVYVDGGRTIQSFMDAGLIRELTLTRIPILLGTGISLWTGNDPNSHKLKHICTKSYPNGMVQSTYEIEE
jgi:dihydrofolate reductase